MVGMVPAFFRPQMNTTEVIEPALHEGKDSEHGTVSITIDGKSLRIRRGVHSVAELKKLGHVPAEYALDQVICGKMEPLPDDGKVHIRGCEEFVSHPKDSSSS